MAPCSRSCSETAAASALVRGTSTRQPNSGLVSYQDSSGCNAAASPTTATASLALTGLTPAALRSAVIRPSVEVTVRCAVVVPSQVMATGVPSGQPAAISILPRSAGPAPAPSTTSEPGPAVPRLGAAARG